MGILKKRLKGSTLVEVIIAMVIILTCMGIAITIFANVSRAINDDVRVLAEIRLNTLANESKIKNDFSETLLEFDNLKIQRSILPYPSKTRLKILHIEAFAHNGKKIAEYKEIISIDNITK